MEKKNLNHIVQEKLKTIEDTLVPGSRWNKENSWVKIKELLNTKNKKLIFWYFACAASMSLAFAATLNENLNILKTSVKDIVTTSVDVEEELFHPKKAVKSERYRIDEISSKPPNVTQLVMAKEEPQFFIREKPIEIYNHNTSEKIEKNKFSIQPTVGLSTYFGSQQFNSMSPNIDFSLKYSLKRNERKNSYVAIGIQSSLIQKMESESNRSTLYPATFVTSKYGESKIKANGKVKNWEIEAGYLINPDHIIYDDSTFRFQYSRTILGRLRGGPELIFTNKFKKIYPGFTLVFG